MASRVLSLRFPTGGIHRRLAYQTQPPFTTPDALNVLPDAHPSYRERGGSRRGIGPAFREQLGSGNPVRMMGQIHLVEDTGFSFWADDFLSSTLGTTWTAGTWTGVLAAPRIGDGFAYADSGDGLRAVTRAAFSPAIDAAQTYEVEMFICPHKGRYYGDHIIYARMAAANPTADGVVATLTHTGESGAYSGSLKTYAGSVLKNTYTFTAGTDSFPAAGWFTLKIAGDVITCYWRTATLLTQNISADSVPSGTNVGFGLKETEASTGRVKIDSFRVQYDKTGGNQQSNRALLVASSNGLLYKEDFLGSMAQVSTSLTLASDRRIFATEKGQKLYIADYGDTKLDGTDGVVGTAMNKLDAASVSNWTAHSISTNDDVVVISAATGDIIDGVYAISAIASGEITLTASIATAPGTGTCTFRIERGPKVYDPAAGTLSLWMASSEKGSIPVGQRLLCLWRDRLVLAGGADGPHIWYMSRQGDPNDFLYTTTDEGTAVAGNNANAGVVGEPITALIPHEDICLYIGCYNSLWVLRGDPAYGGQIDKLSDYIGVVSGHSWCFTPEFQVVFLSHDGVYLLGGNCGSGGAQSISRELIPAELLNVDANLVDVSMGWDMLLRGVHIYLTYKDSQKTNHWFLDWATKSFWRWALVTDHEPTALLEYFSYHAYDNGILLGGRDGRIRRYHNCFDKDDGNNNIDSHVFYGPFNLGGEDYREGGIVELMGMLATDSAPVTWSVHTGKSSEAAFNASSSYSGSWTAIGLSQSEHPRVRGASGFIKLAGNGKRPWSVENVMMRVQNMGRIRV